MLTKPDSKLINATATYNAAADHFDAPALAFWDRHGRKAVELVSPPMGARVLDVGCGTGASALPAAERVGPEGLVVGLDVAENMLQLARSKAKALELNNVSFLCNDMSNSGYGDEQFDAVISVFSIFFVEDMDAMLRELWRMLRSGGELVVTTWGPDAFQPCAEIFSTELSYLTGKPKPTTRPWERLCDPENLISFFTGAGLPEPTVCESHDTQPLLSSLDWWTIALGSGFRADIDQLRDEQREILKCRVLRRIEDDNIQAIQTSALHAVVGRA